MDVHYVCLCVCVCERVSACAYLPLGQVRDTRYECTTLTSTPTPTTAPTRINTYLAWNRTILVYHNGISFCFADPHCSNETRFQEQRFSSRLSKHKAMQSILEIPKMQSILEILARTNRGTNKDDCTEPKPESLCLLRPRAACSKQHFDIVLS